MDASGSTPRARHSAPWTTSTSPAPTTQAAPTSARRTAVRRPLRGADRYATRAVQKSGEPSRNRSRRSETGLASVARTSVAMSHRRVARSKQAQRLGVGWPWAEVGMSGSVLCPSRPAGRARRRRSVGVSAQMSPAAHGLRARVTPRSVHVGPIAKAMAVRSSRRLVPHRGCARDRRAGGRHWVGRYGRVVRLGGPLHELENSRCVADAQTEDPGAAAGDVMRPRVRASLSVEFGDPLFERNEGRLPIGL